MIGKATTFDIKDTNPSKSFGLPRDLLVEARSPHSPRNFGLHLRSFDYCRNHAQLYET